jgi:hypothetical protein
MEIFLLIMHISGIAGQYTYCPKKGFTKISAA